MAAHCQPEGVQEAAALDPHNGAADFTSLSFPSFVETMCRLSWVLHPGFRTLPEKFEQCVRQQVRPNARADSRDAMQKQVSWRDLTRLVLVSCSSDNGNFESTSQVFDRDLQRAIRLDVRRFRNPRAALRRSSPLRKT